jgi:hypothetical protein
MRLSQLKNDRYQGQHENYGSGSNNGEIRAVAPYQRPISGLLGDGTRIKILATGDITGMSPCFQVVDDNGRTDWVSTDEVQITDEQVLPHSQQQLERFQQHATSGSSTSRR